MTTQPSTNTEILRVERMPRWYTGRSELIVAFGVLLLAGILAYGTINMRIVGEPAFPGPKFFPIIVTIFLAAVGIALTIDVLRPSKRAHVAGDPTEISDEMLQELGSVDSTSEIRVLSPEEFAAIDYAEDQQPAAAPKPGLDWRTIGWVTGSLAAFILVMPLLGWLISSAGLFWAISWAFGSKRPLFDIGLAALIAGIVQLTFSAGLGLSLPAGILEGVFPWIS